MNDELLNITKDEFLSNFEAKLDEHGTRNKKGKAAIAKLLTEDQNVREAEKLADRLEVDPLLIGKCLALAMFNYKSGRPTTLKELINLLAVEGLSVRNISEGVVLLLVDLGVLVKEGERGLSWQAYDKIGVKPSFFAAHVKPLFISSEAKQEIIKENDRALEQATKLKVIEKQNAIAQRAKLVALQAANAHAEAAKTLATVPSAPQGAGAFIKHNFMPLVVIGLLGVVVAGSVFSNGTPANTTVELAAYPQPTHAANYPQPTYKGE